MEYKIGNRKDIAANMIRRNTMRNRELTLGKLEYLKRDCREICRYFNNKEDKSIKDMLDYAAMLLNELENLVRNDFLELRPDYLQKIIINLDTAFLIIINAFVSQNIQNDNELYDECIKTTQKGFENAYYFFSGVYTAAGEKKGMSLDDIMDDLDLIRPNWLDEDEEEIAE